MTERERKIAVLLASIAQGDLTVAGPRRVVADGKAQVKRLCPARVSPKQLDAISVGEDEKIFLAMVRDMAHIGYGRMLQIVALEWSESHPARAAMELRVTADELRAMKAADPLARFWSQDGKESDK